MVNSNTSSVAWYVHLAPTETLNKYIRLVSNTSVFQLHSHIITDYLISFWLLTQPKAKLSPYSYCAFFLTTICRRLIHHFISSPLNIMPTELPYAADAEVSLSFDELEVCRLWLLLKSSLISLFSIGSPVAISKRGIPGARKHTN